MINFPRALLVVWFAAGLSSMMACQTVGDPIESASDEPGHWQTNFFDDFKVFDPENWQDQRIWVNSEDQCYVPDGAHDTREVSDGTLKLRVVRLDGPAPCDNIDKYGKQHPDTAYAAGRICSKNRKEFTGGRWSARLRLETSGQPGMFPAWWLLGARNNEPPVQEPDENVYWPLPGSGEIDIFEHHGDGGPGRFTTGAIKNLGKDDGDWWSMRAEAHADLESFHTYSVEWAGDDLVYRVDGTEVYRNEGVAAEYYEPMFAILNYAKITDAPMTGNWTMEVDWVRHESWKGVGEVVDPRAPKNVFLTDSGGVVSLVWDASDSNVGDARYSVYRSELAGEKGERIASGLQATEFKTKSPEDGLGYYYTVTTSVLDGDTTLESARSLEVRTAAPAFMIPARIQAEGYADMNGIQTEQCGDAGGGLNLGYFDIGDTVDFRIRVDRPSEYSAMYRVASLEGSAGFEILVDGRVVDRIEVPATGEWQDYVTIKGRAITLGAGEHNLSIRAIGPGWNINWFELSE